MSLRTFTENVMVLAVENCLLRSIPDIFEPVMVSRMENEEVATMAAETRAVREEREMLERDLATLEKGLGECRKFKPRDAPSKCRRMLCLVPRSGHAYAEVKTC